MQVIDYTWRDGRFVPISRKSKQENVRFAKGPIPIGWLLACRKAGPDCHLIAADILGRTGSRIDKPAQGWVMATESFGQKLGLSRFRRYRAINGLKTAGLAEVERKPNRAPRVRLVPWKGKNDDGRTN